MAAYQVESQKTDSMSIRKTYRFARRLRRHSNEAERSQLLSARGNGHMADIADDKSHRNVERQSPTSPAQTSQQPLIQADSRSSNQQRRNTVVFHMEQCQYAWQEHGMTAKVVPGSTLAMMNKTFPNCS